MEQELERHPPHVRIHPLLLHFIPEILEQEK